MLFKWFKQLNRKPSLWSLRDWQRVLSGHATGDLTLDSLLRSSAVIACSSLIADSLAAAPMAVVQRMPSGGLRAVVQSDASALLATLQFDDRAAAVFGCATLGNGWIVRDVSGVLYALDSNRASPYIDDTQRIWIRPGADTDTYIPYSEIAHIRWRSVPGYVLAINPLLLATDSMRANIGINRMAGAMAQNASSPGVVLEYPGILTDKAINNIKNSWVDAVGADKQGGVAILEQGVKMAKVEAPSATDAQLVQALEWSAADVARCYAVPPEMIGLLRDSNRATSVEASRAFVMRCLRPWSARVCDPLSRLLLTPDERAQGLAVEIDLEEMALGQGEERARYARELVAAGVATPNEMRNSLGFEDAEGGEVLRFPMNTAPSAAAAMNADNFKMEVTGRDELGRIKQVRVVGTKDAEDE